jgi:translation initiation factor 2 subunit 3
VNILAADEICPQPQTSEHLAAIEIMKLQSVIILQNKIDRIEQVAAENQHEQIINFIQSEILFIC